MGGSHNRLVLGYNGPGEGNMVSAQALTQFTSRLVQEYHPRKVILFGSYAYGTPTPDSDIDLLVVMPFAGKPVLKSVEILNTLNPDFPIDLIVRTPEDLDRRLALNDFFLQEIIREGKVLYAGPDA